MSASANIAKFLAGLKKSRERAVNAARRAVDLFGEHVIGDSQQLTPIDTGALAASATTLPAEVEGEAITKVIGHNTHYAAAVHERLDQRHKQGQAKFLATAIEKNRKKFEPFVAGRVKKAMEGGAG